jgi:hypothetical protein
MAIEFENSREVQFGFDSLDKKRGTVEMEVYEQNIYKETYELDHTDLIELRDFLNAQIDKLE